MVLPLIPALAGHALRFGVTSSGMRSAAGQFAQSLPFGAGYSLGTYLGFPKNYQKKSFYSKSNVIKIGMPYRRYNRYYSRYGRRYRPRYRSYRRYYRRY